ncbi:MAG: hypothetical protein AAGA30_10020, partial [Planctomycetota bacterium]
AKECYTSHTLFFQGTRTTAICTKVQMERSKNRAGKVLRPENNYDVSFTDSSGQQREEKLQGLTALLSLFKGEQISVVYLPTNPTAVYSDSMIRIWGRPALISICLLPLVFVQAGS